MRKEKMLRVLAFVFALVMSLSVVLTALADYLTRRKN